MEKTENNVRIAINNRTTQQLGGDKGISVAFNKLKKERGWKTPQPLYNVKNGDANLTQTTLYDIGCVDKNFSADFSIFGEYRFPESIKLINLKIEQIEIQLQNEREERKKAEIRAERAEIRAERAEGSNEVLQAALKEAMKEKGINFHTGDTNRLLADDILMIALYTDTLNKSAFSE